MFNGGGINPEQFHQFIASTTRTALPLSLPLTLPLNLSQHNPPPHHHPNFISSFDPQLSHHHHQLFQSQLLHHHHHQLHQNSSTHEEEEEEEEEKEEDRVVDCGSCLEQLEGGGGGGVRSVSEIMDPWEKEEVLALLRIRSNMGTNGFSDFIWEHVSRKLAELGFQRSAEKCKEKFEEMDQYNNNTTSITNYGKNNYNRSFSELEALFEDQNNPKSSTTTTFTTNENMVRSTEGAAAGEEAGNSGNETLENPYVENQTMVVLKKQHRKKRKRHHKLELLKGLCEEIVNKIMFQQEELHRKLLEDMERKEEQRVAREEAWKKKEMDRVNKEIEIRAQEQAIACDRESTIIDFLKKLTSTTDHQSQNQLETSSSSLLYLKFEDTTTTNNNNTTTSQINHPVVLSSSPANSIFPASQNPNSISRVLATQTNYISTTKLPISSSTTATATTTINPPANSTATTTTQNNINPKVPNSSSTLDLAACSSQNPSSSSTTTTTTTPIFASSGRQDPSSTTSINEDHRDDIGKRWPRDEVYSLINLRCNIYSNNIIAGTTTTDQDKETTNKVPLWERISQGMLELGYKRSAKKCKEKWENINKYFRKTKDANKKRSLDSKTCPYFHQLNTLYNQGTLTLPSQAQDINNHLTTSPENQSSTSPKTRGSTAGGFSEGAAAALAVIADHHHHQGEKNINNNISQVSPLEFEY